MKNIIAINNNNNNNNPLHLSISNADDDGVYTWIIHELSLFDKGLSVTMTTGDVWM